MPETIAYTQTLSISGGPTMTDTATISAEAYSKLSFTLEPLATDTVNLQASDNSEIKAMFIRAFPYGNVTYTQEGISGTINLSGPLMLVSPDHLDIAPSWHMMEFANNDTNGSVLIEIFFVRTASAVTP
jgi:hypothetical protein